VPRLAVGADLIHPGEKDIGYEYVTLTGNATDSIKWCDNIWCPVEWSEDSAVGELLRVCLILLYRC